MLRVGRPYVALAHVPKHADALAMPAIRVDQVPVYVRGTGLQRPVVADFKNRNVSGAGTQKIGAVSRRGSPGVSGHLPCWRRSSAAQSAFLGMYATLFGNIMRVSWLAHGAHMICGRTAVVNAAARPTGTALPICWMASILPCGRM